MGGTLFLLFSWVSQAQIYKQQTSEARPAIALLHTTCLQSKTRRTKSMRCRLAWVILTRFDTFVIVHAASYRLPSKQNKAFVGQNVITRPGIQVCSRLVGFGMMVFFLLPVLPLSLLLVSK